MNDLVGKNVLITGAAGGLGSELALQFGEQGCQTVLLDKNLAGLEMVHDRMEAEHMPPPFLAHLDLSSAGPPEYSQLTAELEKQGIILDGLIHCAASFDGLRPLDQVKPHEWLSSIQVNLNSPWLLTVQCLPLLLQSGAPKVFFILENLSRVARAYWGPYGAAKHAVRALVGQIAAEFPQMQVLGIDPGPMATALRARAYGGEASGAHPAPKIKAKQIVELYCSDNASGENVISLVDLRSSET